MMMALWWWCDSSQLPAPYPRQTPGTFLCSLLCVRLGYLTPLVISFTEKNVARKSSWSWVYSGLLQGMVCVNKH